MKAEETFDFPIRWAWHKLARLYNLEAQKHGLTMSVGYCLLNIDRIKGTPSTKLGPLMGMEARSLTRTLKTMEKSNLIYRKSNDKDRRLVRIMLTPLGLEKREVSKQTVIKLNKYLFDKLSQEDVNYFFRTMQLINSAIDEASLENEIVFSPKTKAKI
jgi:DNA-binding MarR family transcriptional regulator